MKKAASAAPVVLTVDVEDFFEPRPPFDTYLARIGSEAYGVPLIMDMLERWDGRGTFFVDVYNRRTVTEEVVAETVRIIDGRGHEVGLHTHPAFPEGRRGYGMAQTMRTLALDEQTAFMASGIEMIERWIGKRPVSHRAGGYGANIDTLKGLAANGMKIDSSLFYGYPYCDLNQPQFTVNAPAHCQGVLEVPITVTRCDLVLGPLRLFSLVKKLDPDWCSPGELRRQIAAVLAAGTGPVVVFLHSYSLLDIENGFKPNRRAIDVLDGVLAYVREVCRAPLVSLEEAVREHPAVSSGGGPALPTPPPIVRSNLAGGDLEPAWWLMRRIRPRHVAALVRRWRTSPGIGR